MAIMGRAAAQVAAVLMARVMEVAGLIPASRATKINREGIIKVARVVTISNLARGVAAAAIRISKPSKAVE